MGFYITVDGGSGIGKGAIISWLENYLLTERKYVEVVRDNHICELRDEGAQMVGWCKKNGVDPNVFLLPLYVADHARVEYKLIGKLKENDFVLRDRSFVSSLAYRTASGVYTQEQVWDLYVNYANVLVPDLAIIVDADVDLAMDRERRRKKFDIGLGGKMSGDRENRIKIREQFLQIPRNFSGRMDVLIVENNGGYTEDAAVLEKRVGSACEQIVIRLKERGDL